MTENTVYDETAGQWCVNSNQKAPVVDCTPKVRHPLSKALFFMEKTKYSLKNRLAVVNHYLAGKDGTHRTAEHFGVERTSVRRRVRAR